MNFDFSDDSKLLRDQARRFLGDHCTGKKVRQVLEGRAPYLREMWQRDGRHGLARRGDPRGSTRAPGWATRRCAFWPRNSAACWRRCRSPPPSCWAPRRSSPPGPRQQKREHLPRIARGETVATVALGAGPGEPVPARVKAALRDGRISGEAWPVPDGGVADLAVVAARDATGVALALVDLTGPGVTRTAIETLDPTRPQARLAFDAAPAAPLAQGWDAVRGVLDRAAVLVAFEQVGGASACLEMATAYAKERYAFGRPIGSFQAIKHKLADVYVASELARSNAYFGAWALSAGAAELPLAAATARVSASEACFLAARRTSRCMAASASPGRWTATCSIAAPSISV